MATTTNYNWTTPDDTDLVKDGAAAIRTLGTAIDTTVFTNAGAAIAKSLVDDKGDIIAATADNTVDRLAVGTNDYRIVAASGEATGLKYVADTQNTVIDAEGDLLVGDSADTLQKLTVGTTGQVLTVDTAIDGKIKWATTISTPTFTGWRVNRSASFTLNNGTTTFVSWDDETFDTDTFHDNSTNPSRITIPSGKDGYYAITAKVLFQDINATGARQLGFVKNGVTFLGFFETNSTNTQEVMLTSIVNLSAADYIEVRLYQTSGNNFTSMGGSVNYTYFVGQFLGA